MTAPEAVDQILKHIETKARRADPDDPYRDLLAIPELPLTALSEAGSLTRLDTPGQHDTLPSLLIEDSSGQAQIEFCPFGPLALITSDGGMNTDPIVQVLIDAEIIPLFPSDLDQAGKWHGTPLSRWLFPQNLRDALSLFDTLR